MHIKGLLISRCYKISCDTHNKFPIPIAASGEVMNASLDTIAPSLHMTPPSHNITHLHGPAITGAIDGVVNFNGTGYIFADHTTYVLGSDDQVTNEYDSYDYVPTNKFQGMPVNITGATELSFPNLFFFKGVRYYSYNAELKKVIFAGILIN